MRNGRSRCKATGKHCRFHGCSLNGRFPGFLLAVLTGICVIPILTNPETGRLHLECRANFLANLHHFLAANTADSFFLGQTVFYYLYRSSLGNNVLNTA